MGWALDSAQSPTSSVLPTYLTSWGVWRSLMTPLIGRNRYIQPKLNKASESAKPFVTCCIMKLGSLIQIPSTKPLWNAPSGEITMTSFSVGNKTLLSWNHASQIKSCYGTLSGSHGRSFRIRHEKSPEVPPVGGLTITSYPVGNTTSLSWNQCMVTKKLLWIIDWKNPSWNVCAAFPGGGLTMTSCPVGNKTSLSRKPCIADKKLLWITIMKSWSLSNFYNKNSKY